MEPTKSVIVCTNPRTGSGLLCELLWRSGVVGRPDEWFSEGVVARAGEDWGTGPGPTYVRRVLKEGTTSNGVFGMKFHWSHWDRFTGMAGASSASAHDGTNRDLGRVFPHIRYVWLRRRDKVRQAVSRFVQRHTGITKTGDENKSAGDLRFDFAEIDGLVTAAVEGDRAWQEYFGTFGPPIQVVYEDDLEHDQEALLERLSNELGWEIAVPDLQGLERRKLSDGRSEELVSLYRERAGTHDRTC